MNTNANTRLGYVVNCHNCAEELKDFLSAADKQNSDGATAIQLIIVDNGSTDDEKSRKTMLEYEASHEENTVIIPLDSYVEAEMVKEMALDYASADTVQYLELVSDDANRQYNPYIVGNKLNVMTMNADEVVDWMLSLKSRSTINIAVALNDKYFMYTYVMLYSLMVNNQTSRVRVFLLNDSLNEDHIRAFKALAMDFGGIIIDVKFTESEVLKKLSLSHDRFSKETYFRLGITEFLPDDVDRLLYLDADTLVNGDITAMYNADFNGNELMAVKETDIFDAGDERSRIFGELLADGYVYFNAGVLLMNIAALRGKYTLDTYLDKLKELKNAGFAVTFQDQDLLNLIHHERIGYIESEYMVDKNPYCLFSRYAWNAGMDYDKAKQYAKIIHYCGYKPWNGDGMHYDIELLWWDYAKQTVLYPRLIEEYLYKTMTDTTIFKTYLDQRLTISRLNKQIEELSKK